MIRRLAKAILPSWLRLRLRAGYERIQPLLYAGWSVECPCCGAHYREFLPHGRPERRNSQCRRCDAVERHRLLFLYLKNRTDFFQSKLRLLHFAPEHSFRKIFLALPNVKYVSTDYCGESDVHMDITNLALSSQTVDAIICMHVLEHIPNDVRAMRELLRVLKPGGWAILQVPIDLKRAHTYEDFSITSPEQRRIHFGQEDHVRWYGRDYIGRLESAGFVVTVDDYVRSFTPEQQWRYGLSPEEDVYFCRRPV